MQKWFCINKTSSAYMRNSLLFSCCKFRIYAELWFGAAISRRLCGTYAELMRNYAELCGTGGQKTARKHRGPTKTARTFEIATAASSSLPASRRGPPGWGMGGLGAPNRETRISGGGGERGGSLNPRRVCVGCVKPHPARRPPPNPSPSPQPPCGQANRSHNS